MSQHPRIAPTIEAEISAEDAAWLRKIDWNDAAVPPLADSIEAARYARLEKALNQAMKGASYAERGESAEGRMAAALGARLADWRDSAEGED